MDDPSAVKIFRFLVRARLCNLGIKRHKSGLAFFEKICFEMIQNKLDFKKRLKCAVVVVVADVADDYVVDKAEHILFNLNTVRFYFRI